MGLGRAGGLNGNRQERGVVVYVHWGHIERLQQANLSDGRMICVCSKLVKQLCNGIS
jgi:hypothetical protein